LAKWNVEKVEDMMAMFNNSEFNQPIANWNVSKVTHMNGMFWNSQFNQEISSWCVINFSVEPDSFSTNSPLTAQNKPIWGTCPD
jgi:surface protein